MTHTPTPSPTPNSPPPGWPHWFGTDVHGRDLAEPRLLRRAHLAAGRIGGRGGEPGHRRVVGRDRRLLRRALGRGDDAVRGRALFDAVVVFVIVLITALNAVLAKRQDGPERLSDGAAQWLQFAGLFGGLGAVSWLPMARIVRGQVLSLRHRAFMDASRVLGAGHGRILLRHILPNVYGVIIVYLTLTIPSIIIIRIVFQLSGAGHSAAAGQPGIAHCQRRRADKPHPHLLVADCFSRRDAGLDPARPQFRRRRPARRLGPALGEAVTMNYLPIVERELRMASRRGRTYYERC